ncbi:MAG: alpha/beta hydrolase-fold protein [Actinomycetota bacterium]|nr:alpha/beta hydrolase-fold protein [Actinomycetota bacterium]
MVPKLSRRSLLVAGGGLLAACAVPVREEEAREGLRLTARPDPSARARLRPGTSPIRLATGREGLLHVPRAEVRSVVVALHGAGGNARSGLRILRRQADRLGFALVVPASRGRTWDAVMGSEDRDTRALNQALAEVLRRLPVAPERVAVAGFSDGGTYALTLALANGDLFPRAVAFSPGFENADRHRGRPELFVTHGTRDTVLPIDRTSRPLVEELRGDGYAVTYREFDGGHTVPEQLADEAAQWLLR